MNKFSILSAAAAASLVVSPVVAQAQAARPAAQPAQIDGKPNLNGIWFSASRANDNLEPHSASGSPIPAAERLIGTFAATPAGLGVIDGDGKIPYKPEALAKLQEHRQNLISYDPEAACYLPGIPRASYMDYPFQIIQGGGGDDMLMVYEYANANRVIEMRDVEIPPIDTWMGTSFGEWEGNTLVVHTLAQSPGEYKAPRGVMFEGVTWLDRTGNYIANTTTVHERFTLVDPTHIQYTARIEDENLFTRPWTISMTLYKNVEPNAQLLEFRCVPFSELMLYGDLLENTDQPAATATPSNAAAPE
ncbi:MAG: hypothetical protein B7Z08_05690 [Sphingomonadales bacterium 32-68-7]|nr:MAG: hypothetical protein B7Z33_06105 [Sphingomonadales bacterium 12-68-11]OYX09336.1 MAG: hypothetical protein B7Z08_05690 [Sphingomonadales bacterium 32-68-7]